MIATGRVFGAVVLLFSGTRPMTEEQVALAHGLVDLAAAATNKVVQHQELARAHEEIRASRDLLQRTEKLRSLGEMAAGICHDLRNLVAPLSLHLQIARRAIPRDAKQDALDAVAECEAIVGRVVSMIERLRDFSRQAPESRVARVDLSRLLREAAEIARPRMASRRGAANTIVEQLGAPPPVVANAGEVVSALVNLVVNAIDAMPGGGTITLRSGVDGQRAFVSVADEGPGMSADVQARIFEPFFTTKGDRGTGLGLAMVYACMQRHGGTVTLDTAPGQGATFTLWFPLANE
jgi:signal transduction histidine kinase